MNRILLIFLWFGVSCTGGKNARCSGNEKFKSRFFAEIGYVKKHISLSQDKRFLDALVFISNYAPVSFEEMVNYSRTYGIKTLLKDEPGWLNWYLDNKCNDIQLQESYRIPEKYQVCFY